MRSKNLPGQKVFGSQHQQDLHPLLDRDASALGNFEAVGLPPLVLQYRYAVIDLT